MRSTASSTSVDDRRQRAGSRAGRHPMPSRSASISRTVPPARGAGRAVRLREEAHPADQVPGDYITISSGLGEAPPLNIIVLPVLFEGGEGGDRACLVQPLQRDAPVLPRPAHRIDRHRAQHDRGEHAHGRPAEAVAAADHRAAEPAGGAEEDQRRLEQQAATLRQSEELLRQQQEELQQTNEELEDKARLLEIRSRGRSARTAKSSRPSRRWRRRPSSSR